MSREHKNSIFYLIIAAAFLGLPGFISAQSLSPTTDSLVQEYILPITSYQEIGSVVTKRGIECEKLKQYDENEFQSCQDFSDSEFKTLDNGFLKVNRPSVLKYKMNIQESGDYEIKIQTANDADNFANLKKEQIDYALSLLEISTINDLIRGGYLKDEGEAFLADENYKKLTKYDLIRSLIFSIYINNESRGFMVLKATDANTAVQEGKLVIGNLQPGEHEVEIRFLNDGYFKFSSITDLPEYTYNFSNVDLNGDKILDTNPVIFSASLNRVQQITEAIGIRIYENKNNKYPATWYFDNVKKPSSGLTTTTVDGYQAVKDGDTTYVSAARVNTDAQKVETFIYVIDHNTNAVDTTLQIFNLLLENFQFNTNLRDVYTADYELKKDQLRRDTIRKADITYINGLLADYRLKNNKFPVLSSSTFVKAHSISTWPSWNASLGSALGGNLPSDPLNYMSSAIGQNDCSCANGGLGCGNSCTAPTDCDKDQDCVNGTCVEHSLIANCATICSRDASFAIKTGCKANEQCIEDKYCAACPLGYDATTCWDEKNLKFAFSTHSGCNNSAIDGSFNIGGTNCKYDGAFVYQYTSVDDGKKYLLNYRLEYETSETCQPGECLFNGICYRPGQCMGQMSYCLAGTQMSTCGDGFLESECGEECDGNLGISNLCSAKFGDHNWYTPVKGTCTKECNLEASEDLAITDCGGYCGDDDVQSDYGETCDDTGAYCINCRCVPNCKGLCGGAADGCGGKCTGLCSAGQICSADKKCVDQTCAEVCAGRCGQYGNCDCGGCLGDNVCNQQTNKCEEPAVAACLRNCENKACGSDGCGGSCGVCGIGKICSNGVCIQGDCATTCFNAGKVDVYKKIYPCGDDGCGNKNGCWLGVSNCQGYKTAAGASLGQAWQCNPLLGRCTCYLSPSDPNSCENQGKCSGTDACGKPCIALTCDDGPCNVAGSYDGNMSDEDLKADECIDCSKDCKVYRFNDCFDYMIIDIKNIPYKTVPDYYQVAVSVPTSFSSGDDLRFVDDNDRTKAYWHYKVPCDTIPNDLLSEFTEIKDSNCYWVRLDNYSSSEKTIYVINGVSSDPSLSSYIGPKNDANETLNLWDDFSSGIKQNVWDKEKASGVSVSTTDSGNKKLSIKGTTIDIKYEYEKFSGITSKNKMPKNTLVKVDFTYKVDSKNTAKNWKANLGIAGFSINAEYQDMCDWAKGQNYGGLGLTPCYLSSDGTDNRYVSEWQKVDCGPYTMWWVCDGISGFKNNELEDNATINTRFNNEGKLIYSKGSLDNYVTSKKAPVGPPASVSLMFSPDEPNAYFEATFDNLIARRFVKDAEPKASAAYYPDCAGVTIKYSCVSGVCSENAAGSYDTLQACQGACSAQ